MNENQTEESGAAVVEERRKEVSDLPETMTVREIISVLLNNCASVDDPVVILNEQGGEAVAIVAVTIEDFYFSEDPDETPEKALAICVFRPE